LKLLLITDQHFGVRNDAQVFLDYFDRFYTDIIFPYIDKHNITHVVDLGDTFDRRKYINYITLKRAKEMWFDRLAERNVRLDCIIGNHTVYYKNTNEVNSMDLLVGDYPNLKIFKNTTEVNIDGLDLLYVPWINAENIGESTRIINETKAQVLFGHLEIQGFQMYKGRVNKEHGETTDLFDKFDFVASGHFHHKSTQGNIHYLGAVAEYTWSDYNDPRGFHIFDTDTRKLRHHRNPYKMFHKVWYDDGEKTMEEICNQDFSRLKGAYVKVIISKRDNPFWFDKFLDEIYKVEPQKIDIVDDHFNAHLEDDEDILDQAEDTATILSKYVKGMQLVQGSKQLDKLMQGLYNEAMNTME
tara:strand:- start:10506 stop:11573 length:1068 start_codon:yes stop_codon:yes gene_type:complete